MDTNKIREALESGIIELGLRKAALAELDKAQQPGKVLTDEQIDEIALMAVPLDATSSDVRIAGQSIEESAPEAVRVYVRGALRYARDHCGIGAPAAGLTVDEAMEAIEDDIGSEIMIRLFRARLTAALEAKTRTA